MFKKVISISMLMVGILSFSGCSNKTEGNTYIDMIENKNTSVKTLFLAESQAPEYPTTKGDYEFARLVKEKTDGRINIQVVPNSELGSEKDTIAQARMGAIDFTRVSATPLSSYSKIMTVLSLPYLYRDEDHLWAVLSSDIGQRAFDDIEKVGLVGLTYYDSGARSFYNNKKEIKSVADLSGLRIRVQESDLMKSLITSLGATPTAMDPAAVIQALAVGQIDGAENNVATYVSSSQYNVAKYYTFDEHSRVPDILVASKTVLEGLSKEDQEIIKQAAIESSDFQRKEWKNNDDIMYKEMEAAGVKITKLDQATKEEFKAAVKPVYDKFGADFTDLIKKIESTK